MAVLVDIAGTKGMRCIQDMIHTQNLCRHLDPGLGLPPNVSGMSKTLHPPPLLHLRRGTRGKIHTSMPRIAQEHRVSRPIISNEPVKRFQHVLNSRLVWRPSVLGLIGQHDHCAWRSGESTFPDEVLADIEGIVDATWIYN